MKKIIIFVVMMAFCLGGIFADADDGLFGDTDESFGGFGGDDAFFVGDPDDDLFGGFGGDDDFFFNDGIEELTDVSAKSDLSKGLIFQNGSIKIGGQISTGISTSTILYTDETKTDEDGNEIKETFGDHIRNTTLTPKLSAHLSIDARPTEILRLYTKFGFSYPFRTTLTPTAKLAALFAATTSGTPSSSSIPNLTTLRNTDINDYISINNYFKIKEIFTDFSLYDRAFFRFGIHTVSWGTGYFFSPVSDMINTSSIDPENPTEQVDGSLNLRTQIVFPGNQNCLWFYVIPSTDFTQGTETYFRDTGIAGKADIMIKTCELGIGAFWKYQHAPKVMLTTTGSIKKISFFGEFVYQYGAESEWEENSDWNDKKDIFQVTAGLSYYWKTPMITMAAQYYYDGNNKDMVHQYLTYGHNIAGVISFGQLFGNKDFTAAIFTIMNFGKEELPDSMKTTFAANGINIGSLLNACTLSATLNYSGLSNLSFGLGPYITWSNYDENPVVSLKLSATLGGGRY